MKVSELFDKMLFSEFTIHRFDGKKSKIICRINREKMEFKTYEVEK